MTTDERRLLKIDRVNEIKLHGHDADGDHVFITLDRQSAQQVLNYLKNGILDQTNSRPLMLGG
jgi:hypothetical protein